MTSRKSDLDGTRRIALITGGTQGIGFEAAKKLGARGYDVVVHGRSEGRARAAVEALRALGIRAEALVADLTSLEAVRDAAASFRARYGRLDVLVANAAMSSWGKTAREETRDGLELHFAANYVAHYLLTRAVLDLVIERRGRIVLVGARQMGAKLDFDDLQMTKGWTGMRAITQAKLGLFLFARELGRRLDGTGVTVNVVDPGLVMTGYQSEANAFFKLVVKLIGSRAEDVAETYAWLATAPELDGVTGALFSGKKRVAWKGQAADDDAAARIWAESARWVGLPDALALPAKKVSA